MSRPADDVRREWLARLGRPVALDYPLFAVEEAFARTLTHTIVVGTLATGSVRAGDGFDAVGYARAPIAAHVVGVERAVPRLRTVEAVDEGRAGEALGLTVAHAPGERVEPGQCLAPAGKLRVANRVAGDAWLVGAEDLPCLPAEREEIFAELAAGRGLECLFHTRAVRARVVSAWRPAPGIATALEIALDEAVPIYDGTRFGLQFAGLTVGAGFVARDELVREGDE